MNPYDELDVPTDATADEIKKAYKRKAMKHHPDRVPDGSDDEFKAIVKSYEILSDPQRRSQYDKTGDSEQTKTPIETRMAELFNTVIDKSQFNGDIVVQLSKTLASAQVAMNHAHHKAQQKRGALAKQLDRVRTKRSFNVFRALIEEKVKALDQRIVDLEIEQGVLTELETMLADYWDGEPGTSEQWVTPTHQWSNL